MAPTTPSRPTAHSRWKRMWLSSVVPEYVSNHRKLNFNVTKVIKIVEAVLKKILNVGSISENGYCWVSFNMKPEELPVIEDIEISPTIEDEITDIFKKKTKDFGYGL